MFLTNTMTISLLVFISCLSIGINFTSIENESEVLLRKNNIKMTKSPACQDKQWDETKKQMRALKNEEFRKTFEETVEIKRSWESSLSLQLIDETLKEDSQLYKDKELFQMRRNAVKKFSDPKLWSEFISSAFWDVVCGTEGEAIKELRKYGLYNPFYDFVEHVNDFEIVKNKMEKRAERVYVFGNNDSFIHDIDKIHPVMLVAYAEKFDDQKDTSLWKKCLQNHIDINYHHQGNSLWQKEGGECCEKLKGVALGEMICDKVSRRLQKNLHGNFDETVWDVEEKYFVGLPPKWLSKVQQILSKLKQ
ncbi:uncharacterized protein [Centruroides vittatus]|uniref:uncharacterized protein n=1 Tax=Centruroides vittatus TaxID=120091 RepID=UPI0035102F9D